MEGPVQPAERGGKSLGLVYGWVDVVRGCKLKMDSGCMTGCKGKWKIFPLGRAVSRGLGHVLRVQKVAQGSEKTHTLLGNGQMACLVRGLEGKGWEDWGQGDVG